MKKPLDIINIYNNSDTDSPTIDCMTFVLNASYGYDGIAKHCLGTSYNGVSFSMFSSCHDGDHLGKQVQWNDLDSTLKKHVISRMK